MNAQDQITRFHEFFEKFYYAELLEALQRGEEFIVIDFSKLSRFDPELGEDLMMQPEETLTAAQVAIREFDIPKEVKQVYVRVRNLPQSANILIRNVRSKHLTKMLWTTGVVRQKSDVRPQVTSARFECPNCTNIITVLQLEKKFREPSRCGCGRKGKFKELSKELIDAQGIVLEEASEDLEGGAQPKRMNVFLKNDLVSPINEKRSSPGSKVRVAGWIIEVPTNLKDGGKSTKFDLLLQANYLETIEEDFTDINVTKDEEERIRQLAGDPQVYEKLTRSIAPSIFGHDRTKEALLLQFVGGCKKERADGTTTRGDMHILLVGDPGCGKSQLLKRAVKIAPKARYASGKGVSGAGLCVAPNSILITNPGEMVAIKDVVEPISEDVRYREGVWKKVAEDNLNVQTLSYDLKLDSAKPVSLWKLETPESVIEVHTASGKKVELTGNTQLLTCIDGELKWIKSNEVRASMHIAAPRRLIEGKCEKVMIADLIKSNPVLHGVKAKVREIVNVLSLKYGSIRNAAKELGIRENQLYVHWTSEKARGNIKLREFLKVGESAGKDVREFVQELSLYNGKIQRIPAQLNENLLYLAGLIAGDGDIRKSGETYSIRFSNETKELQKAFRTILNKEFGLKYDIQKGDEMRPEATRTHSKILKEILEALGIPESPKSHRTVFSPILLKMNNQLLSHYIAGMYDTDGCVSVRKTKGSHSIEFYTCSEQYARQLQFVLLRHGIASKIRSRAPTTGTIKGKYRRYNVEIRGRENIRLFKDNISLRHPKKRVNLEKIYSTEEGTPNLDIIPGAGIVLRKLLKEHNIRIGKKIGNTLRRSTAQKLAALLPENEKTNDVKKLVNSDILWEKVTEVMEKAPEYEYVYDVTVEGTHNFVVDGIIVHNTAAVVKDEFLGGWSLEAGALVLSNRGFVMIDELDKMDKEDRAAMHEALEQQSVSISKANIQATLRAETTVLAAANPKFGRFNPRESIATQIDLPPTLINRFDLIFPIKDVPDRKRDEEMAQHILKLHKDPMMNAPEIPSDLLRKFIAYARQRANPKITDEALDELKTYYIQMRNQSGSEEDEFRVIPITARQLEALVRLAEASAKVRLSDKVLREDARRAIELIEYCLREVALDVNTGKIDIDQISTGISATQRSKIIVVKEIIGDLEPKFGKGIPIEDLIEEAKGRGISRDEVEEVIEKLKRQGDIFEPRPGVIQPI